MGGAIAAVDPEATAFAERSAPFMVSIDGMWSDPADDDETIAWVRSAWEASREYGNGGVYLNFTGLADEDPGAGVDTAFGRNLARLERVKAAYDPATSSASTTTSSRPDREPGWGRDTLARAPSRR